jgi:hypothetical protein
VAVTDGGGHINFCIFNGSMTTTTGTKNCGGLVGWSEAGTYALGCIVEPTEVTENMCDFNFSRHPECITVTYCYYDKNQPFGATNEGGIALGEAAEAMASGEACFRMNGDQSVIGWTQNIGTDARPNNEGKAAQVYSDIELRCDGKIIGETGSFSNDPSIQAQVPDHHFENGICTVCGSQQEGFMEPDAEGYYNISNGEELAWFSGYVNSGNPNALRLHKRYASISKRLFEESFFS